MSYKNVIYLLRNMFVLLDVIFQIKNSLYIDINFLNPMRY